MAKIEKAKISNELKQQVVARLKSAQGITK